ncbi:insulinase family protein [Pediococcus ethanolidurans]
MRNISNIAGVCIKYHTGSLSDPDDKRGLTHLVEHMIMQLPLPERNALIGGLHGQTAEHFVSIWGIAYLKTFPNIRVQFLNRYTLENTLNTN